jgi:asparagine synthase (glutamine-hydrolysing)
VSRDPLKPTPLELAAGTVFGEECADPLPEPSSGQTSRDELDRAILPALQRQPCLVTFSGGRDSSAVLALAVALARREGLPLPVPVTVRFANAPGTGEDRWQELVVRHLRLTDWDVIDVDDELDLVGPVAQRLLRRHGVLYPANSHLYAFLLERARGGALLTGFGGDQMLESSWRLHLAEVLAGLDRPRRRDLVGLAYCALPPSVRGRLRRRHAPRPGWLRPEAQREVERLFARAARDEPVRFAQHVAWRWRRRAVVVCRHALELLAGDSAALFVHPLIDPRFLAAYAAAGGACGFGGRAGALRALCAGLLPDEVLERADKARFHYAYFRAASRAFARRWDGSGHDPDVVEVERLRAACLALFPSGFAALPLQTAWLASERRGQFAQERDRSRQRVEPARPA